MICSVYHIVKNYYSNVAIYLTEEVLTLYQDDVEFAKGSSDPVQAQEGATAMEIVASRNVHRLV